MTVRPRFTPDRALIAARSFLFFGRDYAPGDPFPHPDDAANVPDRYRARQYEARAVNYAPEAEGDDQPKNPADLVAMKPAAKNGYYDLTAPWLEKPLTIRGKVNAQKALAELRAEGPPADWVDPAAQIDEDGEGEGDPSNPPSEGADENAPKADNQQGDGGGADPTQNDEGAVGDDSASTAEDGNEADTPGEGGAGKSEDDPASA